MDLGLVLDKGHHNSLNTEEWLEGEAENRCPKCGYLESYALPA